MELPNQPAITVLSDTAKAEALELAASAQRLLNAGQDISQLSDAEVLALCIVAEAQLHVVMMEHTARMSRRVN